MANQTPSKRLKRLYDSRSVHSEATSLKDFAVDLGANGTMDEKRLVEDWFSNKLENKGKKEK